MRSAVSAILLSVMVGTSAPAQQSVIVDAPGVNVLRGNFAAETSPWKGTARRMLEMVRGINQQYFSDHRPADGESRLGKVTCFTCHQGSERPKSPQPQ